MVLLVIMLKLLLAVVLQLRLDVHLEAVGGSEVLLLRQSRSLRGLLLRRLLLHVVVVKLLISLVLPVSLAKAPTPPRAPHERRSTTPVGLQGWA